jgi:hypothetical protein
VGRSAETKVVRWGMLKFEPKFDPVRRPSRVCRFDLKRKGVQEVLGGQHRPQKNSADEQVASIPVGFLPLVKLGKN